MENHPNKNILLSCKGDFDAIEVSYNHPSGNVGISFQHKGKKRHFVEIQLGQALRLRDCFNVIQGELIKYRKIKPAYSTDLSSLKQLTDQIRDQVG